jgi:hypothetical protein
MKAWEIYSYQHPGWPEPHPAVIVSHPDRVTLKPEVTILLCQQQTGDASGQTARSDSGRQRRAGLANGLQM